MKRIESFCVNHDKLTPGMYVSRIDGDAITYDVRMVVPNAGVYLENDGIHTFEHAFDVTDHELIAGIVTEKGICRPPYTKSLKALFDDKK